MEVGKQDFVKTLSDEMYLNSGKPINEYKSDAFKDVNFPRDERYVVNFAECDSELEKYNEQYVCDVCQKYGLTYYQGDSVCGVNVITDDLRNARDEIMKRMPVGEIRWVGGLDNHYYFTFKSFETVL